MLAAMPFMLVQTDRLILRDITLTDLDNIHRLLCLPATDEFNTLGIPDSILKTKNIVQEWLTGQNQRPRTSYILSIDSIDSKKFIGLIALILGKENFKTAEVWYKIHVDYWRKGYTTEALTRLLDFGFNDLKLHRIEAGCAVENIASYKVLEKAGMTREGTKRKNLPIRGDWKDNYLYAILETEFLTLE
jgi:RimJ/RimL family protein N-acetyltransferase